MRPILLAVVVLASACTLELPEAAPPTSAGTTQPVTEPPDLSEVRLFDVSELVDFVQDGVVGITVTAIGLDIFAQPFEQQGAGTGVVIDDQGHILTNAHVVQDATEVTVFSHDGTERPAQVVGVRTDRDLALIKVEEAAGLTPLPLGNSTELEVGDPVVAIGNALGLGDEPTVSVGIVSAKDRALTAQTGEVLEGLIQTDAAINPGNSGGPLLNERGEVVGINTAIIQGAQNLGFAISVDAARSTIEALVAGIGESFLGVSVTTNNPQLAAEVGLAVQTGAVVVQVQGGSPADQAGLQQADVIVEAGGQPVESSQDLIDIIASRQPGQTMQMTVVRASAELSIEATLGET
ncbi:MAG: S1C family serine protease [Acidimicrobiia bacterium]